MSTGHPRNFSIGLELLLDNQHVKYEFEIGSQTKGGFVIKKERIRAQSFSGAIIGEYKVEEGIVTRCSLQTVPPASSDRLFLVVAAGLSEFRPAYDALLSMGSYNLNPDQMKEVQKPDAGQLLSRDGSNIASVIARLGEDNPLLRQRIRDYLALIVPEVTDVSRISAGHHETLEFHQKIKGSPHPWRFLAGSMSDGTLRALGMLTAVMQLFGRSEPVRLVGIEEPETALHPAAAGALMDALREASGHTQIIATTHSPDLLDRYDPSSDKLLVIAYEEGSTRVGEADEASVMAIRDHLFSAGDLLRMDQLQPVPKHDLQRFLFDEALST